MSYGPGDERNSIATDRNNAVCYRLISWHRTSLGHGYKFVTEADSTILSQVLNIIVFTVPGVLIGGQIGPLLQARLNPDVVKVGMSLLFMGVGVFMLSTLA